MPRQLPWKVGTARATPDASSSRSPAPTHNLAKPSPTPTPKPKPKRGLDRTSGRSPSTSPPPEPLKEELMIEGVDHDDKYRMVEDEFLAVAGDFTRHLHAAEYQRLKSLTDPQNAEAIKTISRPITGDMTDLVKRRHAALDRAAKQRKAIASVLGKRADSDDAQTATSLQGLMDSPRKKAAPLTSLSSFTTGSRAGDTSPSRRLGRNGGVEMRPKQEPESDGDDDADDDLDGPSRFTIPRRSTLPVSTPASERAVERPSRAETWQAGPSNSSSNRPARLQSVPVKAEPEDDDDDPFARMRARREEQKRRRESNKIKHEASEEPKTLLSEIPFV